MSTIEEKVMLPHHYETTGIIQASAGEVFALLDDHARLSVHMNRRSWMMAGSRMDLELDALRGIAVGAKIRLSGRVLGIPLSVEEAVTERNPPARKVWETTVPPQLVVIGDYRMGYDITSQGASSLLRVFIDYALPGTPPARWLGYLFGGFYAKWCTRKMVDDASQHFKDTTAN
jgi:hypothetical protein